MAMVGPKALVVLQKNVCQYVFARYTHMFTQLYCSRTHNQRTYRGCHGAA